ncbi:MAG TPA: cupredoxin domain-containing protein [Phenylobacterium sp.]|jgi:plastocyanin|nr:cupredoxin domain-containing protein [Phenylobacterium sp.]
MAHRSPLSWGLALVAGAALAAASVSAPALARAAKAPKPHIYPVTIEQMKFSSPPPEIHVGDTIEWINNDIFVHSATAKDKSFDVELQPKQHLWTTFHAVGTYAFYCRYHPGMTGTLVVKAPAR